MRKNKGRSMRYFILFECYKQTENRFLTKFMLIVHVSNVINQIQLISIIQLMLKDYFLGRKTR